MVTSQRTAELIIEALEHVIARAVAGIAVIHENPPPPPPPAVTETDCKPKAILLPDVNPGDEPIIVVVGRIPCAVTGEALKWMAENCKVLNALMPDRTNEKQ